MIDIKVLSSSSKGNCYRVTDGKTSLLLECGLTFKSIKEKLNFKTSDIQGCLITHEHKDHCKSVKDVLKAGIDCYLSKGTQEAIELEHHRINIVESKKQFTIGTWTILPFDVQHDVNEPLGYLLVNEEGEKLLFATDTYYIKYKFKGLTHLLVECNYCEDILEENIETGVVSEFMRKRLIKSHFSLTNFKEFLKANDLSQVEEIWMIHLSGNNSDSDKFLKEVSELTGKMVFIAE